MCLLQGNCTFAGRCTYVSLSRREKKEEYKGESFVGKKGRKKTRQEAKKGRGEGGREKILPEAIARL